MVFQDNIREICEKIQSKRGLTFIDGSNINSQVGITNPDLAGANVCHLNLYKTFCIPHWGGSGVGPILCNDKLNLFYLLIFSKLKKSKFIGSITSSIGEVLHY